MDAAQLESVGVNRAPAGQVEQLAKMGLELGFADFVCSPQEVVLVRALTGQLGS